MPSIKHEGLVQPFHHRPALAPELLADTLGVKLPDWQHAQLGAGELTQPHSDRVPGGRRHRALRRHPALGCDGTQTRAGHRRQVLDALAAALRHAATASSIDEVFAG